MKRLALIAAASLLSAAPVMAQQISGDRAQAMIAGGVIRTCTLFMDGKISLEDARASMASDVVRLNKTNSWEVMGWLYDRYKSCFLALTAGLEEKLPPDR